MTTFTVAKVAQDLATRGFAFVPRNPELLVGDSELPVVARRAFHGPLAEVVETVLGQGMLSDCQASAPAGWHRGRNDIVSSNAPSQFLLGIDVVLSSGGVVEVVQGSGRLRGEAPVTPAATVALQLPREHLLLLDARLVRRWPEAELDRVTWFSLVRSWLEPLRDFSKLAERSASDAQFWGVASRPARSIEAWLAAHSRRAR